LARQTRRRPLPSNMTFYYLLYTNLVYFYEDNMLPFCLRLVSIFWVQLSEYPSAYLLINSVHLLVTYLPVSSVFTCLYLCVCLRLSLPISTCLYLPPYLSISASVAISTCRYLSLPVSPCVHLSLPVYTFLYWSLPVSTCLRLFKPVHI
jgi:hypothetical protein